MEWNEWDDGDAGDSEANHNRDFEPWPPAPLPPHERTWRHPSELGATTVHVTAAPQPAMSRKATAATVAVGVLLVAGAVRLMVPGGSPSSGASSELSIVTSPVDASATVVQTSWSEPTTATTLDAHAPTAPTVETLLVTTTFADDVSSATPGAEPAPPPADWTMLGTGEATYAVVLAEGRYLATPAAAVDGLDLVQLHLPSGGVADAVVVVRDEGPIALLGLTADTAAPEPHGEAPGTGARVTVGAPDGQVDAIVGEVNDAGYRLLTSDRPLHESGPVLDEDGLIVGICTRIADADWLVPVQMLDELAAQQPDEPPATSVPTSTTTSTSTSVPTSTTTSTSSTTSTTEPSTTSTTEPPTTSTTEPSTTSTADVSTTSVPAGR